MKIVIVEDEIRTANRLEKQLKEVLPEGQVIAQLDSAASAMEWFRGSIEADIVFMDIDLGDGSSLEVLDQVEVHAPIIFTTAYDEYALEAFKANSIDYLLKPIKTEDLQRAVAKLNRFRESFPPPPDLSSLNQMIRGEISPYQQRFLIRLPQQIKAIDVRDVAYFYIESRLTFMQLKSGPSYPIDFSLDQLESRLHPGRFFRLNRQFTICFEAVKQMIPYPKSRIKLVLEPLAHTEVIVSSERSAAFKDWLRGNEQG